jgi:hypothetical protein
MFYCKPEVNPEGVCREIWYGIGIVAGLKKVLYQRDLVVTALTDGVHNPGSLHPLGKAADLRIKDMTEIEAQQLMRFSKQLLEPLGFDVVFEGGKEATPVTSGAHIHIEFQPKAGEAGFIQRRA